MLTGGRGWRSGRCDRGSTGARLIRECAGEGGQEIFRCRVMLGNSVGGHFYSGA